MINIIGAGGVGSWLAPAMCKLVGASRVTIIDGDKLEEKNLDRQLFSTDEIGQFKADALAKKYGCLSIPQWYSHGAMQIDFGDIFMVCVDNNAGRRSVLETCDANECLAIFGANEVTSAEAYYYDYMWSEGPADPRYYYPEILTDKTNDPRRLAIGCTGEAQENNKQLVSANFMAAALMQHLYVAWIIERAGIDGDAIEYLPFRIRQNLSKYETLRSVDLKEKE